MSEPTSRQISWIGLVAAHEPDLYADPDVYRFSKERRFKSTDKTSNGIYMSTSQSTWQGAGATWQGDGVTWQGD